MGARGEAPERPVRTLLRAIKADPEGLKRALKAAPSA
jgi:hypothetical protein